MAKLPPYVMMYTEGRETLCQTKLNLSALFLIGQGCSQAGKGLDPPEIQPP